MFFNIFIVLYQKLKEILKIHNFNTYLIKKYFLKITYTTTVNRWAKLYIM